MASLRYTPLLTEKRMEAMLATVKERSNALCLLLLCGEKRNGGRIENCAGWNNTQWTLACGVDGKPKDCPLYHWENDSLVVDIYDAGAETAASSKSEARRNAAAARWSKCNANADANDMQMQCKCNANADANDMQMQCKCNANADANENDLHVQDKYKVSNKENMLASNTQLIGARKLSLEQAKDFSVWMRAMHTCHPVTAMRPANSVLPDDIEEAAVTAFLSFPNAPQYADILADYMRSKQETDNHRTPYFRPNSERMFFSKLGDWIGHAQRWSREHPRRTAPAPSTAKPAAAATADVTTDAERASLLQEITNLKSNNTQQQ